MEQERRQVDDQVHRQAQHVTGTVGDQQQQGVLVEVVVEGTGKLGQIEGQKTPLGEQSELAVLAHDSFRFGAFR